LNSVVHHQNILHNRLRIEVVTRRDILVKAMAVVRGTGVVTARDTPNMGIIQDHDQGLMLTCMKDEAAPAIAKAAMTDEVAQVVVNVAAGLCFKDNETSSAISKMRSRMSNLDMEKSVQ
jgi:hypothetical protein